MRKQAICIDYSYQKHSYIICILHLTIWRQIRNLQTKWLRKSKTDIKLIILNKTFTYTHCLDEMNDRIEAIWRIFTVNYIAYDYSVTSIRRKINYAVNSFQQIARNEPNKSDFLLYHMYVIKSEISKKKIKPFIGNIIL